VIFQSYYSVALTHTHKHNHFMALLDLSRTTWVSQHEKGKTKKVKTNLDLLEKEILSGSDGPYADLHITPDR